MKTTLLIVESKNVRSRNSDETKTEISTMEQNKTGGWFKLFLIDGELINFKLDTGSDTNVLPKRIFDKLNTEYEVQRSISPLYAFGGSKVYPFGYVCLRIQSGDISVYEKFALVEDDVTPILSLQTLIRFGLIDTGKIETKSVIESIATEKQNFICKNKSVFEGFGTFPDKLKLILKENVTPVSRPPRRIPLAIRDKVKQYIDILVENNIIEKVKEPTEWVSNLVVVQKPNGTLRLCLYPKFLNEGLKQNYYEIPKLQDLTTKLIGMEYFSVLDLKDGFYQIQLDDESCKLCTFSSLFGCYSFKRLPFGINIAPETFQRLNERNFGDLPGTIICIDDIMVAGRTETEHDRNLMKVIERAKQLNIKFNAGYGNRSQPNKSN